MFKCFNYDLRWQCLQHVFKTCPIRWNWCFRQIGTIVKSISTITHTNDAGHFKATITSKSISQTHFVKFAQLLSFSLETWETLWMILWWRIGNLVLHLKSSFNGIWVLGFNKWRHETISFIPKFWQNCGRVCRLDDIRNRILGPQTKLLTPDRILDVNTIRF